VAGVVDQNAVLDVCHWHGGEFCLWLAILRNGNLLAFRNLPEQVRKRYLDIFKRNRSHNDKILPRFIKIGEFF